ncbi:hypothetical protein FQ775_06375 [Nitratireductor mangrovi]|uniref:Uncharacterized protein n=1 Tax=Nitratireductor mangrovi TaxID=2599600 RepID=A0A5B8KWU0_9HYPH|nr:hypothetical protein [Nitratireductor mangrovi]QDZ00036.1 hypothetical protein FQ775_06375 [Nitratireductor mangrovi]
MTKVSCALDFHSDDDATDVFYGSKLPEVFIEGPAIWTRLPKTQYHAVANIVVMCIRLGKGKSTG